MLAEHVKNLPMGGQVLANARTRGSLSQHGFGMILRDLLDMKFEGALAIVAGSARQTIDSEMPTKMVYFASGHPIHSRSNLASETLAQMLRRVGRISDSAALAAAERSRRGDGLQGEILMSLGLLSARDIDNALRVQQRVRFLDLFSWREGAYAILDAMHEPSESMPIGEDIPGLIIDGALHRTHEIEVARFVEGRPRGPSYLIGGLPVTLRDHAVPIDIVTALEKLDGDRELDPLWDDSDAHRILYALYILGSVRFELEQHAPIELDRRTRSRSAGEATAQLPVPIETKHLATPESDDGFEETTGKLDLLVDRAYEADRLARQGVDALERNEPARALDAFGRAVALRPDAGEFVAYVAWAQFVMGVAGESLDRVLGELDRASVLSPESYVVHLLAGRVRKASGDLRGAKRSYERAQLVVRNCSESMEFLSRHTDVT